MGPNHLFHCRQLSVNTYRDFLYSTGPIMGLKYFLEGSVLFFKSFACLSSNREVNDLTPKDVSIHDIDFSFGTKYECSNDL